MSEPAVWYLWLVIVVASSLLVHAAIDWFRDNFMSGPRRPYRW